MALVFCLFSHSHSHPHYRFENCVPRRAPRRPYFLRSFMRVSRVRKPESRSFLIMPVAGSAGGVAGTARRLPGIERLAVGARSGSDGCFDGIAFAFSRAFFSSRYALMTVVLSKTVPLLLVGRAEHRLDRAGQALATPPRPAR